MYTVKPRLAALGFALALLTTPSYGQQVGPPYVGPPHNVAYWSGTTTVNSYNDEWNALQNSYYTDVILNFVSPDSNCYVDPTPANNFQPYVQALHQVGKTVLLSFGNAPSPNYGACYNNGYIPWLAQQLATMVNNNGFDGVDIDFEDTSAFGGGANYDGIAFLESLTENLYWNLTFPNNIITHAPQTTYWTQAYYYGNYVAPPYSYVYGNVGQYIEWFNNQFYNQGCPNSGVDCTAQQKFQTYNSIVSTPQNGAAPPPPITMVMGFPIGWCSTTNGAGSCNGDGWLGWTGYGDDTSDLIVELQQAYPNQFGGIMGWDFDQDFLIQTTQPNYYPNGWSVAVAGVLFGAQTPWYGDNMGNWECLDGNATADSCVDSQTQFWKFDSNSITNTVTGMCLDAGQPSLLYQCIYPDTYQSWEFLGTGTVLQNGRNRVVIRNRQTGKCLDGGQTPAIYVCNGGPWQSWSGGPQ
jgi:chitinase